MGPSVFGFLSDVRAELVELGNNLLLVAGGYLVGFLVSAALMAALAKWVFHEKTPDTLNKFGRHLGGFVLALIVALVVFSGKGKPTGEGGEGKGSPNTETTPGKSSTPNTQPSPKSEQQISIPKVDRNLPAETIRVTILAGNAVPEEGRYYLLDDDQKEQAKTLTQIKKLINERKSKIDGKVMIAIQFPSNPNFAPPLIDPKVTDLTRWATEEAKLQVILPSTP